MKAKIRIPTLDPYAFIEADIEGTVDEIFASYTELSATVKGGTGMPDRDFNGVLDKYIWGDGTMTADEYASMNLDQQSIIQIIKRSRKRVKG